MDNQYMPGDQLAALREVDCVGYLMLRILDAMHDGDIKYALDQYELVGRSLRELQRLRQAKKSHDQAEFILNQIKAKQEHDITLVIRRLKNEQQK